MQHLQQFDGLKNEGQKIKNEIRDRTVTYVLGGLGLVVGLAWNEAIKALIEYVYPAAGANTLVAKFGYATVLTVIIVVVTMYLLKEPAQGE